MRNKIEFKIILYVLSLFSIYKLISVYPFTELYYRSIAKSMNVAVFWFQGLVVFAVILNLLMMIRRFRALAAFGCWATHCLIHFFNPLVSSPDTGIVGILYLIVFFSEVLGDGEKSRKILHRGLLIIISNMYLVVGIKKVLDPAWLHGEALANLIHVPGLFTDNPQAVSILVSLNEIGLLTLGTYSTFLSYLCFSFSYFSKRFFYFINAVLIFQHLFIFFILSVKQVSVYLILVHFMLIYSIPEAKKVN